MFEKPSKALMVALRDFVFRHEIFVEAQEFDDGRIFVRQRKTRSTKFRPHRHFRVFLRRGKRTVHFYTLTCVPDNNERLQVAIDFPEQVIVRAIEASSEYEAYGRDLKRYLAQFPKDAEISRAIFGYLRSESRLLDKLLGANAHRELLQLARRYERQSRPRKTRRRVRARSPRPRP